MAYKEGEGLVCGCHGGSRHGKRGSDKTVEVVADREGEVTDSQEGRLTGGGGGDNARLEGGMMYVNRSQERGGGIFSFPNRNTT
jgi:hypothetical protein